MKICVVSGASVKAAYKVGCTPLTLADSVPAATDVEAVLQGYISIGKVKSAVM